MRQLCGCCEGIEQLTRVSSANRPGLSALAYRVGTHATFFESMLARVSLHSFAGGSPTDRYPVTNSSPLRLLLTRESDDPAVALLDAWATVADVLTFYQERIANEGFLRTAIERRSVLELAWLIGYQLRPGVASSTYLAYTLEKDSEVLIPAGTRAQSIPGPGELPQPFETAEDLHARDDWNLLQVRLTRPQILTEHGVAAGTPVYLKGTATNLKVGDPLLLVFANPGPNLYRVIEVEPDPNAGRTKVILQDWNFSGGGPPGAPAKPPRPMTLKEIIDLHHLEAQTRFGINVLARMAIRVLEQLEKLAERLGDLLDVAPIKDVMNDNNVLLSTILTEALPPLREEHRLAREANFTKLEPWVGSLIGALEQVLQRITVISGSKTPQSSLVQVGSLLKSLELPPSLVPRSRQQLSQSIRGVLSTQSDALPKILTTLRPGLTDMFYKAWQNLSVTPLPATQAFALRARASVFGHNAPLKPRLDDQGRIQGFEEWTIEKENGQAVTERFSLKLDFGQESALPNVTITVGITAPGSTNPAASTQIINLAALPAMPVTFSLSDAGGAFVETVTGDISIEPEPESNSHHVEFRFDFIRRKFEVGIDWRKDGHLITVQSLANNLVRVHHNADPLPPTGAGTGDLIIVEGGVEISRNAGQSIEQAKVISLEASNTKILPQSWVALEKPRDLSTNDSVPPVISKVVSVRDASRADYGISGKGSHLELDVPWFNPAEEGFEVIRGTTVFAESELLELTEEPIPPVREAVSGTRIELANLVNGLEPGRWLIITGERADVQPRVEVTRKRSFTKLVTADSVARTGAGGIAVGPIAGIGLNIVPGLTASLTSAVNDPQEEEPLVPGVKASELVMLAGIEQSYDPALPGDKTHTTLLLSEPLAYRYKRDTVKIYGNIMRATNGETRNEILGSGNASEAIQTFTLRQSPLTFLSKPTPKGVESTLELRVNDVLWHEVDSLSDLGPTDRNFVTRIDDETKTSIYFGNGERGARLPTGSENITAVYRTGIGLPGNVKAEQITLPVTKPLGVKEVINPLPATGGADREDRDEGRRNAPLAVMALDRIVSTRDYEDFARTFAGVAKASATRLSDGLRQIVHLTIAGADDAPISVNSDLYRNLRAAVSRFGDPRQPVQIAMRFLKLLMVSANVRIHPDYLWDSVEPKIRAAVLNRFSFKQRGLGQDVVLSEMIETVQSVEGVVFVDVDIFDDVQEDITTEELIQVSDDLGLYPRIRSYLAQVDKTALDPAVRIRPAQLVLVSPLVKETLILKELKG